jgi:N-acetylglucosaminyldiphosphoundecaprenol N-acetyl-beta-D-mannosaminyltransferase
MDKRAWVWGLPLAPLTRPQAVDAVVALVEAGLPSYFITANTHYAMLTHEVPALGPINERAAFVLADGAPLVWASRWRGTPLPERVAGSDLIFDLCGRAADLGLRIFLLGGPEGVAARAAVALAGRYPGLQVVGSECPPFRPLSDEEHAALLGRIREARPDILFVAFGQPKGEAWIARNSEALGVPVCVQVGASLDFVAGRVRRAPRLLQRLGLEWAYRMWLEPVRLTPRYARNARFLLGMIARDLTRGAANRLSRARGPTIPPLHQPPGRGNAVADGGRT